MLLFTPFSVTRYAMHSNKNTHPDRFALDAFGFFPYSIINKIFPKGVFSMKPLRIGILSTASIVPRFVGAAGTMTDCKITALASRNPFRAREKAALWNIPLTFGSY